MKRKSMELIKIIVLVVVFVILFFFSNEVLKRKTIGGPWNYSIKVGGFQNLQSNTIDVIGFGSSHMYCSLDPKVLKESTNISSYVLATQQQSIKISYYYIKEALKTQSPDSIILETYMIGKAEKYQDDAITHDAIDCLPFSKNKMELIHETVPKERRLEYYFPIIKYHTRWKEIGLSDFDFSYKKRIDPDFGYVRLNESTPVELNKDLEKVNQVTIRGEDLIYLNKIIELSKEKDFELILMYAPYAFLQEDIDNLYVVKNYAQKNGLLFINGYDAIKEIEFDEEKDFYDGGHLNETGARKFTQYIAKILSE